MLNALREDGSPLSLLPRLSKEELRKEKASSVFIVQNVKKES